MLAPLQTPNRSKPNRENQKPEKPQPYPGRLASGALPVDPFEMALVISIAGQIAQQEAHDIYQRILAELRHLYRDEAPEKLVSICWRLFALYKLVQSGAVADWVQPADLHQNRRLPSAVVFVAATLPLKTSQGFDIAAFTTALRETSAAER